MQLQPYLKKFDAVRPLLLYKFGGVYMDVDMKCKLPVKELFQDGHRLVFRTEQESPTFNISSVHGNHAMGAVAGHGLFLMYIDGIIADQARVEHGMKLSVIQHTGNG